jgi:hypothetical protein
MIEIYGASDDCIEVSGCEGADEFYADGGGHWQGDLIAPAVAGYGPEQIRVRAEYGPDGVWIISLSQVEESLPFPAWGNGTEQAPNGYSTLVRIDAPKGVRLANVIPVPS